ncbi:hypothetical protein SLE2022_181560 [Rubroshorea leprosula]
MADKFESWIESYSAVDLTGGECSVAQSDLSHHDVLLESRRSSGGNRLLYGHPMAFLPPSSSYGHPQASMINFQSHTNKMTVVLSVDKETIPNPHLLCDDIVESLKLIKNAVEARGIHR